MNRKQENLIYSALGVVLLFAVLVCVLCVCVGLVVPW